MTVIETALGGAVVRLYAPEPGTLDTSILAEALPPGAIYGLDLETTAVDFDRGAQFAEGFKVRLVQFATASYAVVLDMDDPAQYRAAAEVLADERNAFSSHNDMDVLAVKVEFGLDISARNIDTLTLARMADPGDYAQRDLKTLTNRHIGPELAALDQALDDQFLALWVRNGGRKNAKKADVQAFGWNNVDQRDELYVNYAGLDALACRRLLDALPAETGAPRSLLDVEVWLAGAANRIKLRGLRVDTAALEREHVEAKEATDGAEAEIRDLTGGIRQARSSCVTGSPATAPTGTAGPATSRPRARRASRRATSIGCVRSRSMISAGGSPTPSSCTRTTSTRCGPPPASGTASWTVASTRPSTRWARSPDACLRPRRTRKTSPRPTPGCVGCSYPTPATPC
jgi:hypothetical protein